ncbi:MAG: YggS family pyridoxal phosphate-dependent enzyme [Alkaliphilus sp.]|nr:YggS family pyridoxal phosphate-dependent enzyme [Alkaliphilus sp.]
MTEIGANIQQIRNDIVNTCIKVGRKPEEIKLIAVTKTIDVDRMNEVVSYNIKDVGENRVQEIQEKFDMVSGVNWHMIGHLQTNKVKYIIDKVKLIHSLDRLSLATEINSRAKQNNLQMEALIQVNVAREDTKYGLDVKNVHDFIKKIVELNHVKIKGLMTIAPYTQNPEEVRKYFRELKNLFEEIRIKNYAGVEMEYLSMGMTNDYNIAIEEGSNVIRVGTAVFGKRIYEI